MAWLIAHMWIALAGAGFLGLIFGWSFRGILLKGKAVRAAVERDVAQTELEQAKAEIDSLYAAQRNGSAANTEAPEPDPKLQTDLEAREAKLASLTEELARSRAEIETLKTAALASAGAGAVAGAAMTGGPGESQTSEDRLDAGLNTTDAALEWRNRYLESRLRVLESQAEDSARDVTQAPASEGETTEEEIARLRWRNRFLEGRVAYFEGGAEETGAEEASVEEASADTAETVQAQPGSGSSVSNGHGGLDDETEDTAADAVLRSIDRKAPEVMETIQPATLSGPATGKGDDLTAISGIGPKIQDVLHGMGVWHYSQIAEWTAENAAWVDQQLSFSGRIEREEWVSQAKQLAGKTETES